MTLAARHALIFATQFAAVGVILPFLPAVLAGHGLSAEEVAVVLAVGSAVRLVAGPLGGRIADALGHAPAVLSASAAIAALAACGFLLPAGFLGLLVVQAVHSAAIAPIVPLTDAVAVTAARGRPGFDYARVRAAGSIAFIAAALAGGQAVAMAGTQGAVVLLVLCLAGTAGAALLLPRAPVAARAAPGWAGFLAPLRTPAFRRLLAVSALIQASHALYYAFGTLHWQAAGLGAGLIGALWATGVVAEVALFLWGRGIVARLGPTGLSVAAAAAGVLRWGITAVTVDPLWLFPAQVLHAATFGMQHLAAMAVLARIVPPSEAATAQTLHAALGVGLWMMLVTLACGPAYAALGGAGFWGMAALCLAAVPAALALGRSLRTP
ncbi:MFS transporter [Roseomonas stagni]|uniref:MFS transporter n=1 Tax=Falsiroseomonas algicola TaxID=2716930 RepID=A0A6M1LT97_9PROT|nr:MFS transporter [Falsiroseomonas algicola]NGM22814.1 MFS transporter [Falsiroseomonas algicola]